MKEMVTTSRSNDTRRTTGPLPLQQWLSRFCNGTVFLNIQVTVSQILNKLRHGRHLQILN